MSKKDVKILTEFVEEFGIVSKGDSVNDIYYYDQHEVVRLIQKLVNLWKAVDKMQEGVPFEDFIVKDIQNDMAEKLQKDMDDQWKELWERVENRKASVFEGFIVDFDKVTEIPVKVNLCKHCGEIDNFNEYQNIVFCRRCGGRQE